MIKGRYLIIFILLFATWMFAESIADLVVGKIEIAGEE